MGPPVCGWSLSIPTPQLLHCGSMPCNRCCCQPLLSHCALSHIEQPPSPAAGCGGRPAAARLAPAWAPQASRSAHACLPAEARGWLIYLLRTVCVWRAGVSLSTRACLPQRAQSVVCTRRWQTTSAYSLLAPSHRCGLPAAPACPLTGTQRRLHHCPLNLGRQHHQAGIHAARL